MTGKIVILTGAGISAESGMGTYRGPGGLWDSMRIADLATPEGYARDPARVHDFYNMRRQRSATVAPNAAHEAIAAALPRYRATDERAERYHLLDLDARIEALLDPED